MMVSQRRALVSVALGLLLASASLAQTGVAVRVGTLGPGIEVGRQLLPTLAVRVGGSYLPVSGQEYTLEDEKVDVLFTGDAKVQAFSLLADYAPFGRAFRLTAGLVYNGTSVDAKGLPAEDYLLRSRRFTRTELGSLTASVEYGSKIAPYGGVGFGSIAQGERVGLLLDIGVMYSGAPEITLVGTGMLEPSGVGNELVIQEALDGISVYPVISFGLTVRL